MNSTLLIVGGIIAFILVLPYLLQILGVIISVIHGIFRSIIDDPNFMDF